MTSTTKTHEIRGSQKLLQNLAKNGETPSSEEIIKTLNLPAGVTIPHWLVRGTPVNWLELSGTVQTPISKLGAVIDSFVKLNDSSISMKVLINGIPIPDIAHVVVRNTPGEL
jgi:hypothetical protein